MGFSVVHDSPQLIWVPVEPAEVIYTGAIVAVNLSAPLEGVGVLPVAVGTSNSDNKDRPFGVVVGNNNTAENQQYSTTYNAEYITQVAAGTPYGSTTNYANVEGVWAKGDPQAMVQIAVIKPGTVLRGDIFNAAVGTAPTVGTVTTGSGTDGIGCTSTAVDIATTAAWSTLYVRSGKNSGIYRTLTSASATVHTWLKAMKQDMEIGDEILAINGIRPYANAIMQIDSEAMYMDCNADLSSNYFKIVVHKLDLSTAGKEYCEFEFDSDNYCGHRA